MLKVLHKFFALIATLCIIIFLLSTLISELLLSQQAVTAVKSLIVCPGLVVLIPSIILTGITGAIASRGRSGNIIKRKKRRMPFIALNGLLVLIPSAIYLDAHSAQMGSTFIIVQTIEILAGATNLYLIALNIRDGRKLAVKNV